MEKEDSKCSKYFITGFSGSDFVTSVSSELFLILQTIKNYKTANNISLFLSRLLVTMCSWYLEYTIFLDDDSKSNIENGTSSQLENQICIL